MRTYKVVVAALLLGGCGGGGATGAPDGGGGPGDAADVIVTTSTNDDAGSGDADLAQASTGDMSSTRGGEAANRPSYNTGTGFFVLDGKLYDPKGNEFRIRGVDRAHYDSDSAAGIKKSGANAVRIFVSTQYGQTWPGLAKIVQDDHIANHELGIPTISGTTAGKGTSCATDNATLTDAVGQWVTSKADWTPMNPHMMINIANEWGSSNSSTWRDQYIAAVKTLRAAGYADVILIDSGGCGQDQVDLLTYASAVFNADPQKNLVFSFHLYGGMASSAAMSTFFNQLGALQKSDGMVFVIGEFGPGKNIGPSPTEITPGEVIQAAEAADLGWIGWAWDDNDLNGCMSDNNWFSMTYNCGEYTQASDLTDFGNDVVLNSTYGLSVLAKPPTW